MTILWCGGEDIDFLRNGNFPYINADSSNRQLAMGMQIEIDCDNDNDNDCVERS